MRPSARRHHDHPSNREEGRTVPTTINRKLISWASDIEAGTIR